LVVAVIDKH